MEKTLEIINELEAAGLIKRYAIGGVIGLIFYGEAFCTYDLDVVCLLPPHQSHETSLSKIHEYLRKMGYSQENEQHLLVAGVPVRFLPASNDLLVEAVESAPEQRYKDVTTRIMSYEHLIAITIQMPLFPADYGIEEKAGLPIADISRQQLALIHALNNRDPDRSQLDNVLRCHGLLEKWNKSEFPKIDHSKQKDALGEEPEDIWIPLPVEELTQRIFRNKKRSRWGKALLPFEEKIETVIHLQQMAMSFRAPGVKRRPPWGSACETGNANQ